MPEYETTPTALVVAVTAAGLAVFLYSQARKGSRAGRLWVWSWAAFGLGVVIHPMGGEPVWRVALSLMGGALQPMLLAAGAFVFAGQRIPRWVFALGVVGLIGRPGLEFLGEFGAAQAAWVLPVLALEGGAARVLLQDARGRSSFIGRVLGVAVAVHGAAFAMQLILQSSLPIDSPVSFGAVVFVLLCGWVTGAAQVFALLERDREETEAIQAARLAAESQLARRQQFDGLVAQTAAEFVRTDPDSIPDALGRALERFAGATGAKVGMIVQIVAGAAEATHVFRAEGWEHFEPDLDARSYPHAVDLIEEGRVLWLADVESMPEDAQSERALFRRLGLSNQITIPLHVEGRLVGFTTLANVEEGRVGGRGDRAPFQLVAELFASAIARMRTAQQIDLRDVELRRAHRMEAVGRLAGGVAHEFNNLLTVIAGRAELIGESVDADVRANAREIENAADRATELTRRLLAFSRRQQVEVQRFSILDVTSRLADMLEALLGEKTSLTLDVPPDLPQVLADRSEIEQALVNLVLNARDATPDGGRVLIAARAVADSRISLTVSDPGEGMEADVLERAFDPFFTTRDVGQGTGLGLAVVKGIVESVGGRIHVESAPGEGTRIELLLPAAR